MAVIALCSASSSPGVTTTAVGLALCWSGPVVLVDADPTGGSPVLAGYLQGQVAPPDALVDLVLAQQQGRLRATIPEVTVPLPGSQVSLIPGPRSHTQAAALTGLWEPLLSALQDLAGTGQDTIVDAGRLGLAAQATPMLYGADLTLVACRSDLVSLSGARSWLATLRGEFEQLGAGSGLGLLLIGPGRPYSASEVAQVLGVPVVASLAWDAKAARAFSAGAQVRKLSTSALVRSLSAAQGAIEDVIGASRAELAHTRQGARG